VSRVNFSLPAEEREYLEEQSAGRELGAFIIECVRTAEKHRPSLKVIRTEYAIEELPSGWFAVLMLQFFQNGTTTKAYTGATFSTRDEAIAYAADLTAAPRAPRRATPHRQDKET
jgi:hypothetical protein